jgi:hypothetical protein
MAKARLIRKMREEEDIHNQELDKMILETSKTSALHAINLNQLLKKKWTEEKNSYRLMTKIATEKQNRRLFKLLSGE